VKDIVRALPLVLVGASIFFCHVTGAAAEQAGMVQQDRVNVRAAASLTGEVITQLNKGEAVTVLDEVSVAKPKPGEPRRWFRIKLPPNTPVWLHGGFIEPADKTVRPNRLNLRAGPGENYSVIGRIAKGTVVKEIRTEGSWMEIEAPEGAYAFIAAELVDAGGKSEPGEAVVLTSTPPVEAKPPFAENPPAPAPTTVQVVSEPPTAAPVGGDVPKPAALPGTPAEVPPPPPLAANANPPAPAPVEVVTSETKDEPLPKRVVTREGVVFHTFSIQAPTRYGLENAEDGRTMNYLSAEALDIKLDNFRGKKVRVTGEEKLDRRWRSVPVLEMETLRLIQ